jgi:parallel beta-helix repeat protein
MLQKLSYSLLCAVVLLAVAASLSADAQTTLNVPHDYSTIQGAIDAAGNGDTVLVDPGTYFENINFNGKAIRVVSAQGPALTVIDGSQTAPAVTFNTGETRDAVLSGFTIQHGGILTNSTFFNGGIYLQNSSPTISNNILTHNNCWSIRVYLSAPLIQENEISATQNSQATCNGGGGGGQGIELIGIPDESGPTGTGSSALILRNTIEDNVEADGDVGGSGGAGIIVEGGTPVMMNNIIRNNATIGGFGGGIYMQSGSGVAIVQNLIYGNSAGCGGGGLAVDGLPDPRTNITVLVANNTIYNNQVLGIQGNTACALISQIYPYPDLYGYGSPTALFINNIVSGSTSDPAVNCNSLGTPSESDQATFQNNLLYNAGGPFFGSYCIDVSGEDNNIAADPQFVNTAKEDFHLQATSPAIDHGQNAVFQTFENLTGMAFATDLDGNPRIQNPKGNGCITDMGAYEYPDTLGTCVTNETLTSSLNPSNLGQTVTFIAQLSSLTGVPTGAVQFTDNGAILGSETVSSAGTATFLTGLLTAGSHTITATYQPTGAFAPATAPIIQVVNGYPTKITLGCSLEPLDVGSVSLLSILVTSPNNTPLGSIAFTDNSSPLGQAVTLVNGAASMNYTAIISGQHTIVANYIPTGSFDAGSTSCSIFVDDYNGLPTTTTVAASPNAPTYGQPVVFSTHVAPVAPNKLVLTGKVRFTFCHDVTSDVTLDVNGNASLIAPTGTEIANPAGSCSVAGQYFGDKSFSPSSSDVVPFVVTAAPSTTALVSAVPNAAYVNQPVSFTVQITGIPGSTADPVTGQPIPPGAGQFGGTVQLLDGTVVVASAPVVTQSSSAYTVQAVISLSTLAAGPHYITAMYSNDPNFAPSTSQAILETILAPPPADFTLTGPSTITARTESTVSGTLGLASINHFSGPVTLTCSLPQLTSYVCTIAPAGVTLTANGTGTSTVTLAPNRTQAALDRLPSQAPSDSRILLASLVPLTLLSLFGLTRRRKKLRNLLALAVLAVVAAATTACGNDVFYLAAQPGSYSLIVTATGTAQGAATSPIIHTLNVAFNITP